MFLRAGFLKSFRLFRVPGTVDDQVGLDLPDLPEKVQFLLHVDLLEIAVRRVLDELLVFDLVQVLRIDAVHSVTVLYPFAGTEKTFFISYSANNNFHVSYLA